MNCKGWEISSCVII